jgi:hypothetical protein
MATLTTTIRYSEPAGSIITSLGVPGPAGPGVPVGGAAGQILAKIDAQNYNTHWVTPQDDSAIWGQISGDLANQLDLSSALSLKLDASTAASTYLTQSGAASTYQTLSGMSAYLSKAGNLAGLTDLDTARNNLNLGVLNSPIFAALTIQGSGANAGQLGATFLSLTHSVYGQFMISPSSGITFPDSTVQVTAYTGDNEVSWGEINGQIVNQVDLQSALDSKYPASNPSGFIDASALAPYLTSADAASTYAVTARGLPAGGITAQVLSKASNSDYSSTWTTIIPGDRYLTSSTTPNTINNQNKTFIVGTGLSYTTQQDAVISYDTANHMHVRVVSYNPTTGQLDVNVLSHTGSGTYSSWVVNVGGTVPATTVAWGSITGTISAQLDLQAALDTKLNITTAASTYFTISAAAGKANLSGGTFTGKVNFTPVGGAAGLNVGIGGTSAGSTNNGDLWITTGGANLNFRDGTGAWKVLAALSNGNVFSAVQTIDVNSASTALRVTQRGAGNAIVVEDSTTPDATAFVVDQFGKVGVGVAPDSTAAIKVDSNGIMFGDGSTQTVAGIGDAPSDGYTYGRVNGNWGAITPVTNNSQLDTTVTTSAASSIFVGGASFPRNSIIRMTYEGAPTVYFESPGTFIAGDRVIIVNETTEYITFTAGGGVTLLSVAGYYSVNAGGVVTGIYLGGDTWVIYGWLTDII